MGTLKDEIEVAYSQLGESAGRDPISDARLVGRIAVAKALLHLSYEDIYGETENGD